MNNPENICYVVILSWTTGCESDATSTEVMACFSKKEDAEQYMKDKNPLINWKKYYQGCLDIEPIPFNQPCV